MSNLMKDVTKQKLQALFDKTGVKILIIEDHYLMVGAFVVLFSNAFKESVTHFITPKEYPTIDEIITQEKPDIVTVDGNLKDFPPHPVFGNYGPSIVAFIKEQLPETLVFSVSLQDNLNQIALENGADEAFRKDNLAHFLNEARKG